MKSQQSLCFSLLLALFSSFFFSSSVAYNFFVGGKNGWALNPTEKYNDWAGRNRFQVNDTLTFKYEKGSDSVLAVKKEDYYNCNTENPIEILNSATDVFKFDRSGPFFFITGNKGNCQKGQRLIVVVLAIRPKPPPTRISPPPVRVLSQPPATPPKSSASSPPFAHSPYPISKSTSLPPSLALSPSPVSNSAWPHSSPSPSPAVYPPKSSSLSPSLSPSPAAYAPNSSSPSPSPSPPSLSPSPAAEGPVIFSSPATPPAPETSSGPGRSPESGGWGNVNSPAPSIYGNSGNVNSPGPSKSASWAVTPTSMKFFADSIVVSVVLFLGV